MPLKTGIPVLQGGEDVNTELHAPDSLRSVLIEREEVRRLYGAE